MNAAAMATLERLVQKEASRFHFITNEIIRLEELIWTEKMFYESEASSGTRLTRRNFRSLANFEKECNLKIKELEDALKKYPTPSGKQA